MIETECHEPAKWLRRHLGCRIEVKIGRAPNQTGKRARPKNKQKKLRFDPNGPRLSRGIGAQHAPRRIRVVLEVTWVLRRITIDSTRLSVAVMPFARVGQCGSVTSAKVTPEPPFVRPFQAGRMGATASRVNRALYGRNKNRAALNPIRNGASRKLIEQ